MPLTYTLECRNQGDWFTLAAELTNADAQSQMHDYRRAWPQRSYRVVEEPTRRLMVCHAAN